MSRKYLPLVPAMIASLSVSGAALAQQASPAAATAPAANDWPTWGYDEERTAWNRGERTLDKKNVAKLKLQWSTKLSTPVTDVVLSTLTSPIIAAGVEIDAADNVQVEFFCDCGKGVAERSHAARAVLFIRRGDEQEIAGRLIQFGKTL